VAVYLADTKPQKGWAQVDIQSGTLYVRPEPVITREHLTGVQAGSNRQGAGLLALELNEKGRELVTRITGRYPNMRLALVVGRTMLAAPGYTTPVTSPQLIFGVGSEQNATLAARAIAGLAADGSGDPASAPASGPSATGATPSGK
jgi:preprotein translocase subunit SecD